jgi:hypothetical protein
LGEDLEEAENAGPFRASRMFCEIVSLVYTTEALLFVLPRLVAASPVQIHFEYATCQYRNTNFCSAGAIV